MDQPTAVFKTLAPRTPEDDAETAAKSPAGSVESVESVEPARSAEESIPEPAEAADGTEAPEEPEATEEAAPEGDRLKQAVAAWVATAAKTDEAESETEVEAESDAAADAESAAEPAAEAEPVVEDADATPEAAGTPEAVEASADAEKPASAPEEPSEAADAPAEAPAAAAGATKASDPSWFAAKKPESKAEAADEPGTAEPEPGAATGDAAAPAGGPVDQPTTMFRAVRPPAAPAVDQPTTALKLPRDAAGLGSDSERTSTFVPLRPDIPADRKAAKPQAPAAEPAAKPAAPVTPQPAKPQAKTGAPAAAPIPAPSLAEPERTRQQPLPPLPPLDLLAELTNTPPPPPNAWRTTLRRVRIWTPLVLLLLIVFAIVQMVRPLPAAVLKLSGTPAYTFSGGALTMPWPGEGQGAVEVEGVGSMGTYGAQKPAPIASVTKTMTAYVILRDHPIKGKQKGPEITVDKKAAEQAKAAHESTAPVKEGQTYTEKELLQLLMIPSANNVARLLARWDAGSEQAFVDKMNAAAKELGMTQSRYTDPSGLLDSTVSTPRDQLKLAKAVMKFDVFREIVDMPNATIEGVGYIENNNSRLLLKDGVTGIKTGSSTPAGGNLLWSANTIVDGRTHRILGIVMGAQNAERLNDKLELSLDYSYELIKKAQDDVTSATVVKKGQVLGYVDDGLGGRTPVVATKEIKAVGWPGLKLDLELTDGGKAVPHSGKAGDVVGTVSIGEGPARASAPVALQSDLVEPGFDKKLTRVG
ncbi:D-alanyl-D-alanine carboxypeptidase family protein [Streptomyces sp. NPDC056503]|uniref:D-alanyl-D-alanine carboxypeptidase family protein n=1 Tax=Streptomyces sp. NPDC056503 TaxID=3345842 RepID=UPI0036C90BC2